MKLTKAQRRKAYLEGARKILDEGKGGLFTACALTYAPELDFICFGPGWEKDYARRDWARPGNRAMTLILAATI